MARSVPAPSQGRGATTQEEAEGRTAGDQETNKAAVQGPAERGDEEEEEDNDEDSPSSDKSDSSSGDQSKDK